MKFKDLTIKYFKNRNWWQMIADPEVIVTLISGLFFLLFFHTAIDKLIDFQKFKVQLGQSPILSDYAVSIAWTIPTLEIVVSALLIFPMTRLLGLYCSYGLMVMFTAYIIVIMNFTERIPCSCGGIFEGMKWREHLIINILFVIIGMAGIFLETRVRSRGTQPGIPEKRY